MSITINELRPDQLNDALEFAARCGSEVGRGRAVAALSLRAVEDEQTLATAVCFEQPNHRHRVEVSLQDLAGQAELHRALVDKALMKLAAAGVRKFDIVTNGAAEQRDFWQAVSWIDQTLGLTEPRDEAA